MVEEVRSARSQFRSLLLSAFSKEGDVVATGEVRRRGYNQPWGVYRNKCRGLFARLFQVPSNDPREGERILEIWGLPGGYVSYSITERSIDEIPARFTDIQLDLYDPSRAEDTRKVAEEFERRHGKKTTVVRHY